MVLCLTMYFMNSALFCFRKQEITVFYMLEDMFYNGNYNLNVIGLVLYKTT